MFFLFWLENPRTNTQIGGRCAIAGRKRVPVDVLEKRGKTHLTKAEKERRKAEELAIPSDLGEISAPKYIKQFENLERRFYEIAHMLQRVMPDNFCQLDAPMLAQYVMFEAEYETFTESVFEEADPKAKKDYQKMQIDAFNSARAAASALGMFVTDRCKISVTPTGDGEDDDTDIL